MSEWIVLEQPLPITDEKDQVNVLDLLQVVAENMRLLVVLPLVAGLVALGITFWIRPTYTASTTFVPPPQQQSTTALLLQSTLGPLAGAVGGLGASSSDRFIAFLESRSLRDAVVDRMDLLNRHGAKSREGARQRLAGNTKVTTSKKGLIMVEVDDHDPKLAADIANAYVEELTRFMSRLDVTEAQARRAFFEQQLKKAKDALVGAEMALRATGISESAIKSSPAAAVGGVAALMAHVAAKEVQVDAMRGFLTESAPDFKRAQAELKALRSQLQQSERDHSPATGGGDYVSKYRNFKYHETLFELVAKQYEAARIDEAREGSVIQVVDRAIAPEIKSRPKKAQIAVAATVATLFALLLFVFARRAFRNVAADSEVTHKIDRLRRSLRQAIRKS